MNVCLNHLTGYSLHATDGEIGRCKDVLFADQSGVIRYLVADTHKWLPFGREVVISPVSVVPSAWEPGNRTIPVRLTIEQVKSSPPLDEHTPISREYEKQLFQYYGYAYYWTGPELWGTYPHPGPLIDGAAVDERKGDPESSVPSIKSDLRSFKEVKDYEIQTKDQAVGRVDDIVVDTGTWSIRFLVANTRTFLPGGKRIIVPAHFLTSISWLERKVFLDITSEELIHSEEFDDETFCDLA